MNKTMRWLLACLLLASFLAGCAPAAPQTAAPPVKETVIVEKLFSWPGIGSLLVDTIFQRDIPVVQGCVLLIIVVFLTVNLAVDLLYAMVDPRIEY